ncbi:PQQ-binding-like beta-propeller repeat protein, partial [Candidatus Desantisbacteria bacterium]|nr:PQQ-binding-like beta-propeller repeat protein [Candidatus Desantisbacteria bacterium]
MQKIKFTVLLVFILSVNIFALGQKKKSESQKAYFLDFENTYPWRMYGYDVEHSNKIKARISPPLKLLWKKEKNIIPFLTPVIYSGILYIQGDSSKLYSFNAGNGNSIWEYSCDSKLITSPLIMGNFIFTGDEKGVFYCINTRDGKIVWATDTKAGFFGSSPVPDENMFSIYITNTNGWIYNIAVEDGRPRGTIKIDKKICSALTYDNKFIYTASYDSCLYAINRYTKKLFEWTAIFPGYINISPAIDREKIYVTVKDKGLYAVNKNGKIAWKKELDSTEAPFGNVAISENSVYFISSKAVYLFEKTSGETRWKIDMYIPTTPVITDRILYVGDGKGNIHAYNKEKGKLYWEKNISRDKISGLIISEERLYVWTEKEIQV